MASIEAPISVKEPGVKSPGIRDIEINQLNPNQLAKLMGWHFTDLKGDHPKLPNTWRFIFSSGEQDPQSRTHFNLLITSSEKRVSLELLSPNKVSAAIGLDQVETVDLINYNGKQVYFRGNAPHHFISITDKGAFMATGVHVIG